MECPNCTFQNMPGLKTCVRCRGLLDFSGLAIDPPRASHGRFLRQARGMGAAVGRGAGNIALEASSTMTIRLGHGLRWRDLVWCLLPGLAQFHRRQRSIGWIIVAAWICVLLLAAATIGSGFSTLLALSAVSIHSLSVSLALNSAMIQLPVLSRLAAGLVIYASLLLGLYRPVSFLGGSSVRILHVTNFRPKLPIQDGDVLLYTGSWTHPAEYRRGDLVVYDIDRSRSGNVVITSGLGLERIVGLPGDEVETDGKALWVNGVEQPPELCPLGGMHTPPVNVTAGEHQYIIFPAALRWTAYGEYQQTQRQMIASLARVHEDHIRGRVFWRLRPWSRAGDPLEPIP